MNWFNTDPRNIKDIEKLDEIQVRYIQKPSLTIFGPLNFFIRKQWDIIFAFFLLNFLVNALPENMNFLLIGLLIAYIWMFYFSIKNGRRLAWNRNNWKSFDSFVKSEKRWMPWGITFFVIIVLMNIASL
jgi:hypothetical protein